MPKTKYHIELSDIDRERLLKIISDNNEPNKTILRAKILLSLDAEEKSQKQKTVLELAEELGTTHTTIQTVKEAYCEGGLDAAISRKKRVVTTVNKRINSKVIEQIVDLAREQPPEGSKRWSIRLLCRESEVRGIVSHIAPSTMQTILSNENIDLKEARN